MPETAANMAAERTDFPKGTLLLVTIETTMECQSCQNNKEILKEM